MFIFLKYSMFYVNYSYDLQCFIFVTHCYFIWFGFLFKQKDVAKGSFTSSTVKFQFEIEKFQFWLNAKIEL